jgi:hypothetical protein
VFDALDPTSGERVTAEQARRRALYLCPVCRVPVFLRKGDDRRSHFAHRSGEGAETCDRFVSLWTSRPSISTGTSPRGEHTSLHLAELCFGVVEGAPEFSIHLPAYGDESAPGMIVLNAAGIHREIPISALEQGKVVTIPFADAPWELTRQGSIDDGYWLAIQAAKVSLDASTIVFHADRSDGRRVRPAERLIAGHSYWAITSAFVSLMAAKPAEVAVIDSIVSKDWAAMGFTIPDVNDETFFARCEAWIDHSVVPAQPTAWVDAPLPAFTTSMGEFAYRLSADPMVIRANKSCRLEIRTVDTDKAVRQVADATQMSWGEPQLGRYYLLCDGVLREAFQITQDRGRDVVFLVAAIDDAEDMPLNAVQARLSVFEGGSLSAHSIRLKVLHPLIASIVKVNGRSNADLLNGECKLALSDSLTVDADALGYLTWRPRLLRQANVPDPNVYTLGQWLIGVSRTRNRPGEVVLTPATMQQLPKELAALSRARWPATFRPQVMNFERLLRNAYELA